MSTLRMLPTPGFFMWTFLRPREVPRTRGPIRPGRSPIHLTGMPRETPRGSPRLPECLALRTALGGLLFCVETVWLGFVRRVLGISPYSNRRGFGWGFR